MTFKKFTATLFCLILSTTLLWSQSQNEPFRSTLFNKQNKHAFTAWKYDYLIKNYATRHKTLRDFGYGALGLAGAGYLTVSIAASSTQNNYNGNVVAVGAGSIMMLIGGIASIPLFITAKVNKHKANLAQLAKGIDFAPNDSIKDYRVRRASELLMAQSRQSKKKAWLLIGGDAILVVGTGIVASSMNMGYNNNIAMALASSIIIGLPIALLSIPSFINAGVYKKEARILRSKGKIPPHKFAQVSIKPIIGGGMGYASLGLQINF